MSWVSAIVRQQHRGSLFTEEKISNPREQKILMVGGGGGGNVCLVGGGGGGCGGGFGCLFARWEKHHYYRNIPDHNQRQRAKGRRAGTVLRNLFRGRGNSKFRCAREIWSKIILHANCEGFKPRRLRKKPRFSVGRIKTHFGVSERRARL